MLQVGIAGVGFMGWIHWLAYQRTDQARVAAIATRDPAKRAGDWRQIQGNFGPPGEQVDLSEVRCHESLDQLLADPDIDVVDICLPPHLHVDAVKRALEAGKHVLCEKPLALRADDCDQLVAAAEQAQRQLLVAQVLPWFPEYAAAIEMIRGGQHGALKGGIFKRVISDPSQQWLPDFFDPEVTGGPLIDLHVHDAHLIRYLFGMPQAVHCAGRMRGDPPMVEFCNSLFQYDDPGLVVGAVCGVINQPGRSFTHGFEIHLERATLQFEFAFAGEPRLLMPLTRYGADGEVERVELAEHDEVHAFQLEIEEMARSIASGEPSPLMGGELARDAIVLCERQAESALKREPVRL